MEPRSWQEMREWCAGLLERRVIDARPPRVEYVLTEDGLRLRNVLDALAAYAAS